MKLKKDWYKSDRARLLFAIGLNLAFLLVLLLCFEVRFEENDDLTVQKFLDGQTAVKTPFVVYINYFLAKLLIVLYNACGNALPVFALLQYAMLFVSFTAVSYLLLKRLNPLAAVAGSLGLLCFFGADSYLIMTYTKTAGIAAVGGVSLMLLAMEEKSGAKKWLPLLLGAVTLLFSLMLRDKEFLACTVLMGPLGLGCLIYHVRGAAGNKFRAAMKFLTPFLLTLALAAGLYAANAYIWDHSAYYDYKLYNEARGIHGDYGVPDYDEMPELYDALGIDQNTIDMSGFYDTKIWTTETLNAIIEARDAQRVPPSPGECLGTFLNPCLPGFFIQRHIYGLLAVLMLWLCCGKRDWLSFLTVGLAFAAFGVLYLMLIRQGRFMVNRTDVGFFFALAVTLLWFLSQEKARNERLFSALLILLCLGLGYRQNRDYCYFYSENILGDDSAQKAAMEKLIADEHLFLTGIGGVNHTLYSPLETVPAGYSDKIILLGDWCVMHPNIAATMAEYGIVNPYEDVIGSDRAYLVVEDIEVTMAYINKNYDPQARAELVEPLSAETGLCIYRVLE
ncbi:MAG: hypothetical protein ACI4O0_03615 [Candidatus Limivicinus sp.]